MAGAHIGSRFQELLEWLSDGASQRQILADYPQLDSRTSSLCMPMPQNWLPAPKRPADEFAF
jgi:hypothetical protein